MDVKAPQGMLCLFDQVEDPRMERSKLHRLSDILVVTLCAVICGDERLAGAPGQGRQTATIDHRRVR